MTSETMPTSFSEVLERLSELIHQSRTGTLFVVSEQNHLVSFVLIDGVIRSIQYGSRLGENCLAEIAKIRRATFKFRSEETLVLREMVLPDSTQIMERLRAEVAADPGDGNVVASAANKTLPQEVVERVLLDKLGPIGELYLTETDAFDSVESVLERLKGDIRDPALLGEIRTLLTDALDERRRAAN